MEDCLGSRNIKEPKVHLLSHEDIDKAEKGSECILRLLFRTKIIK